MAQNEFDMVMDRLMEMTERHREEPPQNIAEAMAMPDDLVDEWLLARDINPTHLARFMRAIVKSGFAMTLLDFEPEEIFRAIAGGCFQMGFEMAALRYAKDRPE